MKKTFYTSKVSNNIDQQEVQNSFLENQNIKDDFENKERTYSNCEAPLIQGIKPQEEKTDEKFLTNKGDENDNKNKEFLQNPFLNN